MEFIRNRRKVVLPKSAAVEQAKDEMRAAAARQGNAYRIVHMNGYVVVSKGSGSSTTMPMLKTPVAS